MKKLFSSILTLALVLTVLPLSPTLAVEAASPVTYTSLPDNYETVGAWSDWVQVDSSTALPDSFDPDKEYMIQRRTELCYHGTTWDIGGDEFYKAFKDTGYISRGTTTGATGSDMNRNTLSWHIPGEYMYDGLAWDVDLTTLDCPYGRGSADEWYNIRYFYCTVSNDRCTEYDKNGKWMPYYGKLYRCNHLGTVQPGTGNMWVTDRIGDEALYLCDRSCWDPDTYGGLKPGIRWDFHCMTGDTLMPTAPHTQEWVDEWMATYDTKVHPCTYGLTGYEYHHALYDVKYIEVRPKAWYAAYDNNGGQGAIPTDEVQIGSNYTLSDGTAFTKEGYKLDGWSDNASSNTINYSLSQVVRDLASPGQTKTFYAHWKPLWKLTIDYAKPAKSTNAMVGQLDTLYKWYETNVDKINKNITLPSPTIRGWTFLGYKVDGTMVTSDSLYAWNADKTAIGQWRENKYNVRYNDGMGNSKTDTNIPYEDTHYVWTNSETRFTKTGYYIDGWAPNPNADTPVYKIPVDSSIDPSRTTVDSFKKLSDGDGDTVDLYAVWKPIPYVIRIYENYNGTSRICTNKNPHNTCSFHKDYVVPYDSSFTFPDALWAHPNAVVVGYDKNASAYVNPAYKVRGTIKNLTTTPMEPQEFFTIWDNVPTIASPEEANFTYSVAAQWGINVSNNTVSQSDLERWLLDLLYSQPDCYVHDYEWTKRIGDGRPSAIPAGESYGYSVRIESLTPNYISEAATNKRPVSYTVTYVVTDDVGNSATSTTKLFLGDLIDILIDVH